MKISWFVPPVTTYSFVPDWLSRKMRIGYYHYDHVPGSVYLRCSLLIYYLEEQGIRCYLNNPSADADVAVFVRWQGDQAYQELQRQKDKGRVIVFDQVINYFDVAGIFPGNYGSTEEQKEQILQMAKSADVFTCSSEFIRQRASQEGIIAHYIPETVDLRHFRNYKKKESFNKKSITAIWSGQPVKATELSELIPLLQKRDISLTVIASRKPDISGPFECLPYSYNTFPQSILEGDVCVSPRKTDNTYDLGHSYWKIGTFMVCGVPALASPVPSYIEAIQKTGGGKICESTSGWESALDDIAENRDTLWEWSQAAREGMMTHYSTENVVKQYIELFEQLLDSQKR